MSPTARFDLRIRAAFAAQPKQASALRDALLVEGHGHLSEAKVLGDVERVGACQLGLVLIEAAYAAHRSQPRRNRRRTGPRVRVAAS